MDRKGVVLIHGMGSPAKNSFLVAVVNSIADWMANNSNPRKTPELKLNINPPARNPEKDKPSTVTLRHGGQEWVFREVWWSRLVDAPLYDPMIGWTAVRAAIHFWQLLVLTFEKSLAPALLGVTSIVLVLLLTVGLTLVLMTLFVAYFAVLPFAAVLFVMRPLGRYARPAVTVLSTLAPIVSILVAINWGLSALAIDVAVIPTEVFLWMTIGIGASVVGLITVWNSYQYFRGVGRPSARLRPSFDRLGRLMESPGGDEGIRGFDDYIKRLARGEEIPSLLTISQWTLFIARRAVAWLLALLGPVWAKLFLLTYSGPSSRNLNTGELVIAAEIRAGLRSRSRSRILLLLMLPFFHFLNSFMTLGIYVLGLIFVPLTMVAMWILSRFRGVPGVPKTVQVISNRVDRFLVSSLGDIKIYMDEPVQAARIRADLLVAIKELSKECTAGVHLMCHSTGAAIAFETLALPDNLHCLKRVKSLITVGSIMNMVWRMGTRRGSFDEPLPPDIRWVNIFTRYDPALAGPLLPRPPVQAHRKLDNKLTEFEVSNEDDLFRDHSSYWSNGHQVGPIIVREIWCSSDATRDFDVQKDFNMENRHVALRISRRKWQILLLSIPRLIVWYAFPVAVIWQVLAMNELGEGAKMPPIFDWWILNLSSRIDLKFVANPTHDWQSLVAVVIASFALTVCFYLIYGLVRTVLWDGVARELRLFSPNIRA